MDSVTMKAPQASTCSVDRPAGPGVGVALVGWVEAMDIRGM